MNTESVKTIHAFISHSSQDAEWAQRVCDSLEKRKLKCWIAPRDITPGSEWGAAIIDGIDRSRVVVLILSSNANESPQVRREIERAIGKTIPVLPVRIEDIRPQGALEFALSNTHLLDAFTSPVEARLSQLGTAVESLLGIGNRQPEASQSSQTHASPKSTELLGGRPTTQRRRTFVWLAVIPLILCGLGFAVFKLELLGSARIDPDPDPDPEPDPDPVKPEPESITAKDNTPEFQGLWKAVAESINGKRFAPGHVAERNSTLIIRDHSVVHRRQPTRSSTVVVNGSIGFVLDGDKRSFTLRGKDQDGTGLIWVGVYRYQDGFLELCFREATGNVGSPVRARAIPKPPDVMLTDGSRETHYLRLERGTRGPKNRG